MPLHKQLKTNSTVDIFQMKKCTVPMLYHFDRVVNLEIRPTLFYLNFAQFDFSLNVKENENEENELRLMCERMSTYNLSSGSSDIGSNCLAMDSRAMEARTSLWIFSRARISRATDSRSRCTLQARR